VALLWIDENQLGRRNHTEDQRAAVAYRVVEQRSAMAKKGRASAAGKTGGRNHPKVSLSATPSDKLKRKKKSDTRSEVAKKAKVPERKLRAIAKAKKDADEVLGEGAGDRIVQDIVDNRTMPADHVPDFRIRA
jgi:hypothetical protein